jgi:hypothetical protein
MRPKLKVKAPNSSAHLIMKQLMYNWFPILPYLSHKITNFWLDDFCQRYKKAKTKKSKKSFRVYGILKGYF